MKRAVDAGRLGRLTMASAYIKWWRTQEYYDSAGWRGTWEMDGGGAPGVVTLATWVSSGDFNVTWALRYDTLSAVMVAMAAVAAVFMRLPIGTLIP